MVNTSILFSPELDERQLDRETSQIDDRLQEVGKDVPVNFEGDMSGVSGPGGRGGGVGGGGIGAGGAGALGGLASRIPKPVAGVVAASALPIAIAGSVGLGMLSAMQGASARLQTSTSLLGQAWNNVWRPLGDRLDDLFVRDVVTDLVDGTQRLGDAIRQGDFLQGAFSIGDILGRGATGDLIGRLFPSLRRIGLATVIGEQIARGNWSQLPGRVLGLFPNFKWPELPSFSWPEIPNFQWPHIPEFRWPDVRLPDFSHLRLNLPNWLDRWVEGDRRGSTGGVRTGPPATGGFRAGERAERVGGGGPMIGLQTGGRVTQTGVARVHRGELVTDPQRLVSELASAVSSATGGGGGGGSVDMSRVENKLDRLNRNVSRLASELSSMEIKTDRETIGRVSTNGRRERIADRDPTA